MAAGLSAAELSTAKLADLLIMLVNVLVVMPQYLKQISMVDSISI